MVGNYDSGINMRLCDLEVFEIWENEKYVFKNGRNLLLVSIYENVPVPGIHPV